MTEISCNEISNRTRILTFDDDISILLMTGSHHTFLCDTHLGPESMSRVKELLTTINHPHDLIIFNSHSDWDHIWGNCAFPHSLIIGHTTCRDRMKERGAFDLSNLLSKTRGHVELKFPNLTFGSRLCFEDDEIEFFHAPGHTIDSSVFYDRIEKILYVGDLVEDPIPYIDYDRTDIYIETLEMLLTYPVKIMVSAHSGIITPDLIRRNISYLQSVREGIPVDTSSFGPYCTVHQLNLNTLLMFRYEILVRQIQKDTFDFPSFWSISSDISTLKTENLEKLLTAYLSGLDEQQQT